MGDRQDGCDPLGVQAALARAMVAADAPALPVYFAGHHFVPYCGAKPVMKGWNTKRRHAQKGRAGTLVTDSGAEDHGANRRASSRQECAPPDRAKRP